MVNEAIGDLLPSALAVALSPIPIVAVVLVLGSPRARLAGPAFAVGLALSAANPKNLALTLAAGASIAAAGLSRGETATALAVFIALGSSTVVGAVLLHLLGGARAARPLAAIRQFMSTNNTVIMMVVLLLLGAKLLGDGIGALWR